MNSLIPFPCSPEVHAEIRQEEREKCAKLVGHYIEELERGKGGNPNVIKATQKLLRSLQKQIRETS